MPSRTPKISGFEEKFASPRNCKIVFALVAAFQAVFFRVTRGLMGWSALVVAMAFMFVVFGQIPSNDVLISLITRNEWRSRVYTYRYIVTFSVMASTVPLMALIHTHGGFDALFFSGLLSKSF